MNKPCQIHGFPMNHLAKDCHTYKQHITRQGGKDASKGNAWGKGKKGADDNDQDDFPHVQDVMIIFGGPKAYEDRRHQKVTHRLIFVAAPVVPTY